MPSEHTVQSVRRPTAASPSSPLPTDVAASTLCCRVPFHKVRRRDRKRCGVGRRVKTKEHVRRPVCLDVWQQQPDRRCLSPAVLHGQGMCLKHGVHTAYIRQCRSIQHPSARHCCRVSDSNLDANIPSRQTVLDARQHQHGRATRPAPDQENHQETKAGQCRSNHSHTLTIANGTDRA
jgi:hypothetical protein